MNLVVDVGNSRVKWASIEGGRFEPGASFERREPLDAVLAAAWSGLKTPDCTLISSVAGESFDQRLGRWISAHWVRPPDWFRPQRETLGILNGYVDYTRLGSDRWAAVIGARGWCSGAVGVIDCGTALTLDVVDGNDRHLGGWIFPGPELSRRSLLSSTAGIGEASASSREAAALGRTTTECVVNGTTLGLAGVLERWMMTVERALDRVSWIATGGGWPLLQPLVGRTMDHDPDLVLKGLARVVAQHSQ